MNDHDAPVSISRLSDQGTIIVSGSDARSFLQGQLSFDMARLTSGYVELASINSAQGRVQAVTWIIQRTEAIVMILPAALIESIVARLRKFILRAKVTVDSGAGRLLVGTVAGAAVPKETRGHVEHNGISVIHWPGSSARGLMIAPAGTSMQTDASHDDTWRLENLRAGLPVVYPATQETFVAQMLNLDLLQGVSFDKGCYTGQEIIARMHFRGQVKRRMLRFGLDGPPPTPGTRVVSDGNHAGDVVDAAISGRGTELLAVINLAQADATLQIDGDSASVLHSLPLPYPVR